MSVSVGPLNFAPSFQPLTFSQVARASRGQITHAIVAQIRQAFNEAREAVLAEQALWIDSATTDQEFIDNVAGISSQLNTTVVGLLATSPRAAYRLQPRLADRIQGELSEGLFIATTDYVNGSLTDAQYSAAVTAEFDQAGSYCRAEVIAFGRNPHRYNAPYPGNMMALWAKRN